MSDGRHFTWEEWQASRPAKREALIAAGCAEPSRRTHGSRSADRFLRRCFDGARVPAWVATATADREVR